MKFTDNQFTDKQLKKLVSSGNTKKILEYIKKHCTSSVTNDSKMTTAADIEGKGTEESENQQVVEVSIGQALCSAWGKGKDYLM